MNESIRPKFLDLKEGAIVVSLKPFVPVNARLTERNVGFFTQKTSCRDADSSAVSRLTTLAEYSMSHRKSTALGAFHGGAGGDTTTSTGWIGRDTSRSGRSWKAGGRRGPGGNARDLVDR